MFSLRKIRASASSGSSSSDTNVPLGGCIDYFLPTEPAGDTWRFPNGQELDNKTFLTLLTQMGVLNGVGAGTNFTVTPATDLINAIAHGLSNNDVVTVTSDNTLPTPLVAATAYHVINANLDDFQLSTTQGGSAIDITDTGTGTHSFHTTFKLPDLRGRGAIGKDDMGGTPANVVTDSQADIVGGALGTETHTLSISEMPAHTHNVALTTAGAAGAGINVINNFPGSSVVSSSTGGDGPHNNMQPSLAVNKLMRVK